MTVPQNAVTSGIDVSNWQGTIDWSAVSRAGIRFAFVKASEGTAYRGPFTSQNIAQCRANQIICGLYHYLSPQSSPQLQAQNFLSAVTQMSVGPNDLPPVLDLEALGSPPLSSTAIMQSVRQWITIVQAQLHRSVIIYVSPSFWNTHMHGFDATGLGLWIAHWEVSAPTVPRGWNDWTFWQHTSHGKVSGIAGDVDLDWFNGDLAALQQFIQDSTVL